MKETIALGTSAARRLKTGVLIGLIALGTALRFMDLGGRSLWLDEFCTWKVSRMPWNESIRWGPELTKPPLYQLTLRVVSREPRPSELVLRLPAAVCGILLIPVAYWLGRSLAGETVGVALAGLVAASDFQIVFSQEARSYSMLALGSAASTALWFHLCQDGGWKRVAAYALTLALTFHTHYLAVLTAVGHGTWWVFRSAMQQSKVRRAPMVGLLSAGLLCVPMVVHYLMHRTSVLQGLDWIALPTWRSALDVMQRISFGPAWIGILALSVVFLVWSARRERSHSAESGLNGQGGLALAGGVLLSNWVGLILISFLGQPALIDRYAIAASIPAMLIPLAAARRLDARLPWLVLSVIVAVGVLDSANRWNGPEPGFRELSRFLDEHARPDRVAVVLATDGRLPRGWEAMERIAFEYYPLHVAEWHEIRVRVPSDPQDHPIFYDPRGLLVVLFRADPVPLLQRAGRRIETWEIGGQHLTQLLFSPYRLLKVAPIAGPSAGD